MKNSNYWKMRFLQLEAAQNQKGMNTYSEIEKQYRQAQKEIEGKINAWYQRFASNNKISMAEARKMLSSANLKEFKWDVQDYIRYGKENEINGKWMKELENASAKFHISRLEALKLQTQQSLEAMFGNQLDTIDGAMKEIYLGGYYHTAYELQKGLQIGWDIAGLDQKYIEKIISKPWAVDGKNFSERIWSNKQKLISEVHKELTQNILLGSDPQKAINNIAKKMKTSKHNAGRLVMTEEAYFSSAAQKDCFEKLGVEQYEIVATLDSHTSDICRSLDGKVFPMKDFEAGVTAPPFHVYCRSTTVPYFQDEFIEEEQRAIRGTDGKTCYVLTDMTYSDWEKIYIGKSEINIQAGLEQKIEYKTLTEDEYDNLIEKHRKKVEENERQSVMGFDWDNFRQANQKYGYINTDNSTNINAAIRENTVESLPEQSQKTIKNLKNIISRNTIDVNILAKRHVEYDWLIDKFGDVADIEKTIQQAIANEMVITEHQFISASLTEEMSYTDRPVQIIFQVPSGYHAYVTENRLESEVIFYEPSYKPKAVYKAEALNGNEQLVIVCEMKV